jgi:3-oxoadipate enol-lactonase
VSVALHHVVDEGPSADAPVLLLGASLGGSVAMWAPAVPALTARRRVVRFDLRGQGASPVRPGPYAIEDLADDVLALMDRLGVARAAYAGISIGGMVGLALAIAAPSRISGLVACCTSAHPGNPEGWAARAAAVRAAGSTAPIAEAVDRWLTPGFAAEHPDVRAALLAGLLASPAEGYAACCGVLERLDLRPQLPGVMVPTLVIGGQDDEALPPEHGRAIAAAIPGARFALLAGVAHIPSAERPDALAALVLDGLEATA